MTLRAIVLGNLLLLLVWVLFASRLADLDDWLFITGLADIRYFWNGGKTPFSHFLIGGGLNLFVGWIVGRTHRQYRIAMVCAFFMSLVLIIDMPRVLPAFIDAAHKGSDSFWHLVSIGFIDFVFLRLPILFGGIFCVREPSRTVEVSVSPGV